MVSLGLSGRAAELVYSESVDSASFPTLVL